MTVSSPARESCGWRTPILDTAPGRRGGPGTKRLLGPPGIMPCAPCQGKPDVPSSRQTLRIGCDMLSRVSSCPTRAASKADGVVMAKTRSRLKHGFESRWGFEPVSSERRSRRQTPDVSAAGQPAGGYRSGRHPYRGGCSDSSREGWRPGASGGHAGLGAYVALRLSGSPRDLNSTDEDCDPPGFRNPRTALA